MGTVFATTLQASFQDTAAQLGAFAGGEQATFGSEGAFPDLSQIEAQIRGQFDAEYETLAGLIESGDREGLEQALSELPIPAQAQTQLVLASQNPLTRRVVLGQLQTRLDERAAEVAAQVTEGVKTAFTAAITRIFFYALFIIALGWLVTLFVPELPLRKSFDQPSAALD
jgi:hypothetical protein